MISASGYRREFCARDYRNRNITETAVAADTQLPELVFPPAIGSSVNRQRTGVLKPSTNT
jgi:hypothetical protein